MPASRISSLARKGDSRSQSSFIRLLPLALALSLTLAPNRSPADAGSATVPREVAALAGEPVTSANEVRLLIGGPELFPARLASIESAEHSIDMLMYLWCSDESGIAVAEALAAASRRGVRVRVGVDFFNNKRPARVYDSLRRGGVDLFIFNPLRHGFRYNDRVHEKIMIVDGVAALVGGANLCDEYMRADAERGMWQDYELLVRGAAAGRLQERFDATWAWMRREDERIESNYAAMAGGRPRYAAPNTGSVESASSRAARLAPSRPSSGDSLDGGEAEVLLHYQQPYLGSYSPDRSIGFYDRLFEEASAKIIIHTPYLLPPPAFKDVLLAATERGVSVKILTNSPHTTDLLRTASLGARARYRRMLEGGVRIFESPHEMVHGKAIVIDDRLAAVGSHNFTRRSFVHNGEVKLVTDDDEVIARLLDLLNGNVEGFREITLDAMDEWEPRCVRRVLGRWVGFFL